MKLPCALLLLTACAPSRAVYIDSEEPEAVIVATSDAVDFWNDAIGYEALTLHVVSHAGWGYVDPLSIVVRTRGEVPDHGDCDVRGDTDVWGSAFIRVERTAFQLGPDYLQHSGQGADFMAHEMGHALGLSHVDTPGNLMRAWGYGQDGNALTSTQRKRVRRILVAELALTP